MDHDQPATAEGMTAAVVELARKHDPGRLHAMLGSLTNTQLRTLVTSLASQVASEQEPEPAPTGPAQICQVAIASAARTFGTSPEMILSPARSRDITDARSVAMAAARASGLNLPSIGTEFDRDHTTVMHAVNRVAERPRLAAAAAQIADDIASRQQAAAPQRAQLRLVENNDRTVPVQGAPGAPGQGRVGAAIDVAARTFGTTPEALRGPDRDRTVSEARAVAMTAARMTGLSLPKIAAEFGRHHTAVLDAVRRIEKVPPMRELAQRIAQDLPRDEATPAEQSRARRLAQAHTEQTYGSPTSGREHDRLNPMTAAAPALAAVPQR